VCRVSHILAPRRHVVRLRTMCDNIVVRRVLGKYFCLAAWTSLTMPRNHPHVVVLTGRAGHSVFFKLRFGFSVLKNFGFLDIRNRSVF
jgi:hypothetical protein